MKNIKTLKVIVNPKYFDIINRTPALEWLRRWTNGEWQNCNHTVYGWLKNGVGLNADMILKIEEK
jgi:hypothetical protein